MFHGHLGRGTDHAHHRRGRFMGVDDHRDEADYRWQDFPPDMPQAIRRPWSQRTRRRTRNRSASSATGACIPWPQQGELLLEEGRAVRLAGHLPVELAAGLPRFLPRPRAIGRRG